MANFCKVAAPFSLPISNLRGIQFLHILNTCYLKKKKNIIATPVGVRGYLTAVWICICLMANDAVHLSKYLSVTLFRLYWVFTAECRLSLLALSRLLIVLASLEEHGF